MGYKHSNCIVVFNKDKSKVLFCKRVKEPFKGKYNFVGGKVENGEHSLHAAYRELEEETKPYMRIRKKRFERQIKRRLEKICQLKQ